MKRILLALFLTLPTVGAWAADSSVPVKDNNNTVQNMGTVLNGTVQNSTTVITDPTVQSQHMRVDANGNAYVWRTPAPTTDAASCATTSGGSSTDACLRKLDIDINAGVSPPGTGSTTGLVGVQGQASMIPLIMVGAQTTTAASCLTTSGGSTLEQCLRQIDADIKVGTSNVGTASTTAITVQGNTGSIPITVASAVTTAAPSCASGATGSSADQCLRQLHVDALAGLTSAGTPSSTGVMGVQGGGAGALPVAGIVGTYTTQRLRATSVATGGTPVTAFNAGDIAAGGYIVNPANAAGDLCIAQIGAAVSTGTSDTTICIPKGTQLTLISSAGTVSVNAADAGHVFAGYGWHQ